MTIRTFIPVLAGDEAAASGTGWLALDAGAVDVPSLEDARRCARVRTGDDDPCALRVVRVDLADRAVVVGLGARPFAVAIEVTPAFPADQVPTLVVRGEGAERRIAGRVMGACRTELGFEPVFEPSHPDGEYELFLDGFEADSIRVTLSLTGAPAPVVSREHCALALSPRLRPVMPETPVPLAGIPRPPLVAVDRAGCVVAAWAVDGRGRALVPHGAAEVELRVRAGGGIIAVLSPGAPVRDAAFVFDGVAVATASAIHVFDDRGCPRDPQVLATGFGLVVGLGVTDTGELVVVDAAPPPGAGNLRVFRADGSELAAPADFPGRGWYAERRNRGLGFDPETCQFVVDPSRASDGCCVEPLHPLDDDDALHFQLVSDLPSLRARRAYPPSGAVILGAAATEEPLDAGRPGTRWHRVLLFGEIPPGCTVAIETRAADDVVAGHPLVTTGWSRPVVASHESEVPVAAPGDPRAAAADAWVLAGPGRFLWIRLTLRGDGRATPRITGIEVERDRASIGRFLPRFFRDSTPEDDFLPRWLALFENTGFDGVAARMRAYPELFDPRTAPEVMLPYLAQWLELPAPPRIVADPARMRRILIRAAEIAQLRGTVDGLVLIIRLYTDVHVQIRESFVTGSRFVLGCGPHHGPVLGCDTALTIEPAPTYLGDAILGCTDLLECDERSGAIPALFEVLAPAGALCSSEVRSLIELLIESEKPVHTRHVLREIAPAGWVLGVASMVGQAIADDFDRRTLDPATYGIALGGGPQRPAPIGEGFTLGRGSRLATPPGPPRLRLPASVGRTTHVDRP